jgi:hypothetical protein
VTLRGRLTIDRIELLVGDADYPDADAAVEDSWRVALLASLPHLGREREQARLQAVRAANERRTPGGRAVRSATHWHRGLFIFALLLGATGVALVAISARTGSAALALQDGMIIAGILTVASIAILAWLEPLRATGSLWGSHAPARYLLVLGVIWLLFAASVIVFRWEEVDRHETAPVVIGLLLFALAGGAALVLWRRAARSDRAGGQTGVAFITRGLVDQDDAPIVLDALDQWWHSAASAAFAQNSRAVLDSRQSVLAHLRSTMYITEREERTALRRTTPPAWKERRR